MTREAEHAAFEHAEQGLSYERPATGMHDEMVDANGRVRPHWRPFLTGLADLSDDERASRFERLAARVRDIGIAYDIFAEPRRSRQNWHVDLVPLIFSSAEWAFLERALLQRSRLFNALLADLYSNQRVFSEGLVPPALVFSDPSFLRSCHGMQPAGGHLQFYAADLARSPDGRWRIIDNHAETPAGAGFALANRVVHTHVAGDLFANCNAIRLAPFFTALQAGLVARTGRADPRIALLTPGPHHEDYFSHAYLARYLGYLLVEGNDLSVTGDRVWLKTLEGLKEIDLVIRCVDGQAADPLELDPSGFQGPVGFVEASRRNPALVANALGSAIVQNRGLGRYLPRISEALLGETLLIEDAPRLWLGEAAARARAVETLDEVVIRKSQEGTGRPGKADVGKDPGHLSAAARQRLIDEIEINGARLVAEEKVGFGTMPSLTPLGLKPKHFAVRLFVGQTPEGFALMPGGLAMTIDPAVSVALSAPDGQTRDVWVLSDAALAPHVSLWRPTVESARIHRSQRVLQSRVADDLYWLGRYAERADWLMRVLRSSLSRLQEDAGLLDSRAAARITLDLLFSGVNGATAPPVGKDDVTKIWHLARQIIEGRKGARALDRSLDNLYRVANLVRDRLSFEAWRSLGLFRSDESWRQALSEAETPGEVMDRLEEGLVAVAAFNGLMHENMTRNFGWSFVDMGRRLERAHNLCEVILALFGSAPNGIDETSRLLFLLELADSYITYRSRYRLDPLLPLVLDLLLLDESNPRSAAFQLAELQRHLTELPVPNGTRGLSEERRLILALLTSVRLADVESLSKAAGRARLEQIMTEQLTMLPELSNAIARRYFNLTDDRPHRASTRAEPKS